MKTPPPDNHDPFNTQRPEVFNLTGWRVLVFYPVAWVLWLYYKTWRIDVDPASRETLDTSTPPRILATWHNRSFATPEVVARLVDPSKVACLISPSKMAAWEVALFRFLNYKVVRGSTTRRSVQAGIELLRALRAGNDAGITPDGPSGPLYSFQAGTAAIAKKASAPMLFFSMNCRSAIRLKTWDRHMIPLPFARIDVRVRKVDSTDPVWSLEPEEATTELRRVCLEVTEDPFKVPGHE
jgi:lysophospholipid acyltransferase (LPLAT)-like uncharacterized protein